jgi:hypothetical protein
MKSFTMKALAVAVLGLAGVGSAMAATCPSVSTTAGTTSPGGGGAWTSQTIAGDGTMSIANPGLNSTNCTLSVTSGVLSNTGVFVTDKSPSQTGEARYRARFYINPSALTGLTASNMQAKVFNAFSIANSPAGVSSDEVEIRLIGASPPALRFTVANNSIEQTVGTVQLPTAGASGAYRVEFDLEQGTAGSCAALPISGGCFRYWVTTQEAATTDASPTGELAVNNSAWGGVTQVNLGLYTTSAPFRTAVSGKSLLIDEFDSRRQTFIGQ